MRALVVKASRMAEQSSINVRDAALVASLQRIIHYMIAEYGTIAAHAKALGRMHEAAHFAQQANLDKEVDRELSELAKSTLESGSELDAGAAGKDARALSRARLCRRFNERPALQRRGAAALASADGCRDEEVRPTIRTCSRSDAAEQNLRLTFRKLRIRRRCAFDPDSCSVPLSARLCP